MKSTRTPAFVNTSTAALRAVAGKSAGRRHRIAAAPACTLAVTATGFAAR